MTELVERKADLPAVEQTVGLIDQIERICMNPDMDVTKLVAIVDLQERMLNRQAEQEFQIALAEMQADLPIIEKNGNINAKLRTGGVMKSKFAKYEDINRAIMPVMKAHGFSLTFATDQDKSSVVVTGVLRHKGGHKETTRLAIPLDTSGSKNIVQSVGSSLSYGKRYVTGALINITTTDDDDDGQSAVPSMDLYAHNLAVIKNFDSIVAIKTEVANKNYSTAYYIGQQDINHDDQNALSVAPTNGGIFTTFERKVLKEGKSMKEGDA